MDATTSVRNPSIPIYPEDRRHFDEYLLKLKGACAKGKGFDIMMGFVNPLENLFAVVNNQNVSKAAAIETYVSDNANADNALTTLAKISAPTDANADAFRILGMSALPSVNPDFSFVDEDFLKDPSILVKYVRLIRKAGIITAAQFETHIKKHEDWVRGEGKIYAVVSHQ